MFYGWLKKVLILGAMYNIDAQDNTGKKKTN